jgi:hypothetical protein
MSALALVSAWIKLSKIPRPASGLHLALCLRRVQANLASLFFTLSGRVRFATRAARRTLYVQLRIKRRWGARVKLPNL